MVRAARVWVALREQLPPAMLVGFCAKVIELCPIGGAQSEVVETGAGSLMGPRNIRRLFQHQVNTTRVPPGATDCPGWVMVGGPAERGEEPIKGRRGLFHIRGPELDVVDDVSHAITVVGGSLPRPIVAVSARR